MKISELQKKSEKALAKQADELRQEITEFIRDRFQNDERNVRKKKALRKDLARVLTVLNDKSKEDGEEK